MKRMVVSILFFMVMAICLLVSCVSLKDKTVIGDDIKSINRIGTIDVEFVSYQPLHFVVLKENIKSRAYNLLLKKAKTLYHEDIDIVNINIHGSFSLWNAIAQSGGVAAGFFAGNEIGLSTYYGVLPGEISWEYALPGAAIGSFIAGNIQKITATGEVVLIQRAAAQLRDSTTGMEGAIIGAYNSLQNALPNNVTVAVLSISSQDHDMATFVINELEFQLVNSRQFKVVDRKTLDAIRSEQNFQSSGDVDDTSAVSIGKMLGANIVITGSIFIMGTTQRLVLKALDVQTAQIVTMSREQF